MNRSTHIPIALLGALALSASPAFAQKGGKLRRLVSENTEQRALGEFIDFEGLATGTVLTQVFGNAGTGPVLVNGFNPDLGAVDAALVFDSANPTGGDDDLGTPNQTFGGPGIGLGGAMGSAFENDQALGKVLILAENLIDNNGDGLVDNPDDADVVGSFIELDFTAIAPVTISTITILDVEADEAAATVEFFDGGGASLDTLVLPAVGDNGLAMVDAGPVSGVFRIVVMLNGSGAIDLIDFQRDPGSIGDTVFCDVNDDGDQDPG